MADLALALRDVVFAYPGRDGFALTCPALTVEAGERVLLLGPSGAGKSTLLGLICGILAPSAGQVEVAGTDLSRLSAGARDRFRAERIGIVFQMFNLLPYATALDNIRLALAFAPERRRRVEGRDRAEALRLAAALGLDEAVVAAPAGRLSVGQQQRVAVARALIGSPRLVVADEPTSALDASAQAAFLDVLAAQTSAAHAGLLMVSHDARLAPQFDRVVALTDIVRTERAGARAA
ncbi:ABC transporter ATP-binding protein [Acuticoccus sp. I52.16.1]|uniref:ABC transporter ATP-binding protein n=1 Tax=Acuticoccus sp. I52.16.1 TaxID=2928472 RepID=UPI001FD1A218|nr:ATP-binding cassette domain-containing protein [Acuticoccus sp. I52.16.1]UOM32999.1 ATP-binding cassette domain-containing protein [Acuticoccus sp. I52.16.1]